MKKIKLNCAATMEETFADFLTSRKAKGLADKTLQSYEQQFRAVARHLDVKTDIAMLQNRVFSGHLNFVVRNPEKQCAQSSNREEDRDL